MLEKIGNAIWTNSVAFIVVGGAMLIAEKLFLTSYQVAGVMDRATGVISKRAARKAAKGEKKKTAGKA